MLVSAIVFTCLYLQQSLPALVFVGASVAIVVVLSSLSVLLIWEMQYQNRPRCSCIVQRLRCPLWWRGDGAAWTVSCNPVYGMFGARIPHVPLPPLPVSHLSPSASLCADDHLYCEIGDYGDLSQVVLIEETRL
uniref:ORF12 protein n=1 Tax=Psittacine aviadenovirus B TaxID=2169709 RepID=A0AB38ZPD1_9ADEN